MSTAGSLIGLWDLLPAGRELVVRFFDPYLQRNPCPAVRRGFQPRFAMPRFRRVYATLLSCGMSRTRRFIPTAEWEDERQLLGLRGERIAIAFLTSCGWSVEAHRFKLGRHDLDLVVRKGSTVAFVEVKTRRSATCGSAVESVSRRKQKEIGRVASMWVLRQGRPGDEYRFDVVAIQDIPGGEPVIEHVADAWRLTGPVGSY